MKKKLMLVVAAIVVGVLVMVVDWRVFFDQNFGWAANQTTYRNAVNALPAPEGWDPDTNRVHTTPDYPIAHRQYDAQGDHEEILAFFKTTLPESGWKYLGERANEITHLITYLFFDNDNNQCLRVSVRTLGSAESARVYLDLTKKVGQPPGTNVGTTLCDDFQ